MNGFTLRSKLISDFLPDAEGSDGFVFMLNNQPVVQLDFLSGTFTLFWLGSVGVDRFIFAFNDIFASLARKNPSLLPKDRYTGTVSVVSKKGKDERNRSMFSRQAEPVNYDFSDQRHDAYLLRNSIQPLLGFDTTGVISIQIDLLRRRGLRHQFSFSFWADTSRSPKRDKELGITSSLALGDSFRHIMAETSPVLNEVPKPVFDELIQQISDHVAERGYLQ